jgi:hypothetical protein
MSLCQTSDEASRRQPEGSLPMIAQTQAFREKRCNHRLDRIALGRTGVVARFDTR